MTEDDIGRPADSVHGGGQVVGGCGEEFDGLADVPPGGGHADLEPAGEQSLTAGAEAPPAGSVLVTVPADEAGEVLQGPGGQRNRGRVRQHGEAPGWGIGSWSTAVLPGASSYVDTGPLPPSVTCTITMKMAPYK